MIQLPWNKLAYREQLIVIGIGCGTMGFVLLLILWAGMTKLENREQEISEQREQLAEIQQLKTEYRRLSTQLAGLERMRKKASKDPLPSLVMKLATQSNLQNKVYSVDEKSTPPNDLYKESTVQIKIRNVSLDELTSYLIEIERSSQVLRVKRLNIKTRFDNPALLNAEFDVSSFQLKGS